MSGDLAGGFNLCTAVDGNDLHVIRLTGRTDGALIWNNKDLRGSSVLTYSGYAQFYNGLIIQWTYKVSAPCTGDLITWTYAINFAASNPGMSTHFLGSVGTNLKSRIAYFTFPYQYAKVNETQYYFDWYTINTSGNLNKVTTTDAYHTLVVAIGF